MVGFVDFRRVAVQSAQAEIRRCSNDGASAQAESADV